MCHLHGALNVNFDVLTQYNVTMNAEDKLCTSQVNELLWWGFEMEALDTEEKTISYWSSVHVTM